MIQASDEIGCQNGENQWWKTLIGSGTKLLKQTTVDLRKAMKMKWAYFDENDSKIQRTTQHFSNKMGSKQNYDNTSCNFQL